MLALAAAGAWRAWRADARPLALAMGLVTSLGFLLSLGPDGVRWLYAFFHRSVFGFQAIRAPGRFGALAAFGLVVLAAVGLREVLRSTFARGWRARGIVAAVSGLVAL